MPSGRRIVGDMTNIGEQAKPPFAVLPDPSSLFHTRAERFRALSPGHELRPYLEFLGALATAQHEIVADLPAAALPPTNSDTVSAREETASRRIVTAPAAVGDSVAVAAVTTMLTDGGPGGGTQPAGTS